MGGKTELVISSRSGCVSGKSQAALEGFALQES